jgi:hypothetical protein
MAVCGGLIHDWIFLYLWHTERQIVMIRSSGWLAEKTDLPPRYCYHTIHLLHLMAGELTF